MQVKQVRSLVGTMAWVLAMAVMYVPGLWVIRVNHYTAWLIMPGMSVMFTVMFFWLMLISAVCVAVSVLAPTASVLAAVVFSVPIGIGACIAALSALFLILCTIVITRKRKVRR